MRAVKKHVRMEPSPTTDVTIGRDDLAYGLSAVQPSAMREVQLEVPKVRCDDDDDCCDGDCEGDDGI